MAWNLPQNVRQSGRKKNWQKTWTNLEFQDLHFNIILSIFFQVLYFYNYRVPLASAFWSQNCQLENGLLDLEFMAKKTWEPCNILYERKHARIYFSSKKIIKQKKPRHICLESDFEIA